MLRAAAGCKLDELLGLIGSSRSSLRARDAAGNTPLILVSQCARSTRAIRALVAEGASVDVQNRVGQTALMLAAATGRVMAIRALYSCAASVDLVNRKGETALTYSIVWNHIAAQATLLALGADVEAPRPPRWSPLMFAAFEGNSRAVRMLLDHGAEKQRRDGYGRTATDIARSAGREGVARLLERRH